MELLFEPTWNKHGTLPSGLLQVWCVYTLRDMLGCLQTVKRKNIVTIIVKEWDTKKRVKYSIHLPAQHF